MAFIMFVVFWCTDCALSNGGINIAMISFGSDKICAPEVKNFS